jgi:ABC-type multidrug transport system fused ATPase/permease subunit
MPWINAVFVLLGFVVLAIHRFLLPRIKVMQDRLSEITEASTAQTTKIAMEYHIIRLHNKQDHELGLLDKMWSSHPSLAWKTDLINETAFVVMEIGFRFMNALGYFVMGASVLSADISLGTMTMIIMYMDWMRRPISTLMQQMSNRRKNIVRRDRMHAMLNEKNMITDGHSPLILPIGDLVFDQVRFGYFQKRIEG